MEIDKNLSNLTNVFNMAIINIDNIARFWNRLNLGIGGRINIAKTFMLSQIGYIGCFVPPPQLNSSPQLKRKFAPLLKGNSTSATSEFSSPQKMAALI